MLPSQLPDVGLRAVVLDTETSGLHPDDPVVPLPGSGHTGCRVATVSIAWLDDDDQEQAYAFPFDQGILDKLSAPSMLELIDNPNLPESEWVALLDWLSQRRLVFHNAKFDLMLMAAGTRYWPGRDLGDNLAWDTALGQKVSEPLELIALKTTCVRLGLSADASERDELTHWIKNRKLGKGIGTQDNPRYDLVEWSVMEPYAREDAVMTLRLFLDQLHRGRTGELHIARFKREMELTQVLYRMEYRGLGFDAEACLATANDVHRQLAKLAAGLPFEPTLKGAIHYFFTVKHVPPLKVTDKRGDPQLDDEVRQYLIDLEVPHAVEFDHYVRLENALNRWYEGWPRRIGDDGRIRTVFRQTKVKSGRMSVERVQLHAVPKDGTLAEGIPSVRPFFVPRPGYALWNCDLSQAELRAAAKEAKCTTMIDMLLTGADMHGITCKEIFRIDKGHPDYKIKRDVSKRLNFGAIFQIGPKKFQNTLAKAANLKWDLVDCEEAVYRWRNLYPEFEQAYYRWSRHAERHKCIPLVDGEPSYFGPRDEFQSAWNRRVQASLATFLKKWLIATERHWPGVQILTVHDSIVLELPLCPASELVPWGEGDDMEMVHPVAAAVAAWGAEGATRMFGIEMKVDVGAWRSGYPLTLEDAA